MVKIVIRGAKFTDLKHMKASNQRNLTENYGIDYWTETFNANGGKKHSFVACFANDVIGYIFASDDTIISFAIDEPFRKFGIGKQLLAHCLNTFTSDVILHVRVTNDLARNLYKKYDFVDNRLIEGYYTDENAYEMIHKYSKKKYPERSKLNVPYVKPKAEEKAADLDVPKTDNENNENNEINENNVNNENVEWLESRLDKLSKSQLEAILGMTNEHDCGGKCGHHHSHDKQKPSNFGFKSNIKPTSC